MLYKKIDASSSNSITSALGFFETPTSNVGIASSKYVEILTLNPITDFPFQFKIHPTSNYVDLSHIYLETSMCIEKKKAGEDWKAIEATDKLGVVQGIGSVFIRNLKVTMNGRETFNSNSLYSYKSYIDLELSYPSDVKANYLNIVGYHPSNLKQYNQDDSNDEGYKTRKEMFANGKVAQFYAKLNADIFSSDLYLINNVPIDLEIHPNTSEFLLHRLDAAVENTDYRLTIKSCKLYVKMVELMDGLEAEVTRKLQNSYARYGIRKSELKSIFVSEGRPEIQCNIFTEFVPRRIIVGFVESKAFNGDISKSPFTFKHQHVREISVCVGGETVPSVRYDLDYEDKKMNFMRAYHDMQEGCGLAGTLETNGISPARFKNSCCLYIFNMTCNMENSPGFELLKTGTTSIYVRFAKEVPAGGLNMVVYGEMDSLVKLDLYRNLTTDMTT